MANKRTTSKPIDTNALVRGVLCHRILLLLLNKRVLKRKISSEPPLFSTNKVYVENPSELSWTSLLNFYRVSVPTFQPREKSTVKFTLPVNLCTE